jgi:hypothetical protein
MGRFRRTRSGNLFQPHENNGRKPDASLRSCQVRPSILIRYRRRLKKGSSRLVFPRKADDPERNGNLRGSPHGSDRSSEPTKDSRVPIRQSACRQLFQILHLRRVKTHFRAKKRRFADGKPNLQGFVR